MKNYGVFIETFVAKELLDLVVRDGEIKNKNIEICRNTIPGDSVFACGNSDEDSSFDNIIIPKSIEPGLKQEDIYIVEFLNKEYGFDYNSYMIKNNLNFYQLITLFSIFHEIGHIMTSEEDMALYGKLVTFEDEEDVLCDMLDLMQYVEEGSKEEKEIMLTYRRIKSEVFADLISIEFMKRYEDIACRIVRDGVKDCDRKTLEKKIEFSVEREVCL